MNYNRLIIEVESDLTWRHDDIRFFRNQLANLSTPCDRERYCKALVVILYSHFEGFAKVAFRAYVEEINAQKLPVKEVKFQLQAAALSKEFKDFENPKSTAGRFKKTLPKDIKLHKFCRQTELMEQLSQIFKLTTRISSAQRQLKVLTNDN